jgi:hypothetical protein
MWVKLGIGVEMRESQNRKILNRGLPGYEAYDGRPQRRSTPSRVAALLVGAFVLALSAGPLAGTAAATPVLLTLPAITTNAWVGQTLTVTQGTYNDGPTITDEWFHCTDSSGTDSSCSTTTATGPTYTVGTGDIGFYIKVKETATDTVAPPRVTDTNVTFLVAAAAPTLQTAPRISDTTSGSSSVHQGDTLSVANGTWSRPPDRSSYQWLDCDSSGATCTAIQNATNSTYVTGPSDTGHTIQVQETPHYGPTALAAATALIGAPVNSSSDPPTISGTAQQGQTLTASPGTWSPAPTSFKYQWQDCDSGGHGCTAIPSATGQTYTLAAGDVGDKIVVLVTATNAGGASTVTSAATDVVQTTSTVSLTAAPNDPVTNQGVTLVATVTSQAAAGTPSGSVAFLDNGKPISGCAQQVALSGQSVTVLCQTSFAAETAQLAATFTPAAGSLVLGSSSSGQTLAVGQATTTTALDASPRVPVQASTTYTATVAPAADRIGPLTPSGSVQFLDGGKPIPACAAQPLRGGGATCTVKYASTGRHSISARYLGDANFSGSSSTVGAVPVTALIAKGTITATMQWTFVYTPIYTRVINLVVNGVPTGATVQVLCQGRGCPFAKRSRTMGKPKRCSRKQKRSCPVPGRVSLTSTFLHHNLRPGAQIAVEIRRPQYIGKYYSFTMRPRKQPRVRIACLAVNATRPSANC